MERAHYEVNNCAASSPRVILCATIQLQFLFFYQSDERGVCLETLLEGILKMKRTVATNVP